MKVLRRFLLTVTGLLLVLLLGVAALWSWSGSDSSIATALQQLTRLLPAGQTLETKDVTGSLRSGGHIGWLRWRQGELSVEANDLASDWVVASVLTGKLRLTRLAIGRLRIDDRRAAAAPTPPTDLRLPLYIDAQLSVAALEWSGSPTLLLTNLSGHYIFDGQTHRLDAGSAQLAGGSYRFSGQLQAQGALELAAQVQGSVQASVPGKREPMRANAELDLKGPLAGRDATLELQAQLTPETGATAMAAMQASVSARLQPWQPQTIVSATAQWQALNLAALWPQAPQTRLDGKARVTPTGSGWRAEVQLGNTQAGPWNRQSLPLERLQAALVYTQGQWVIDSLQASVGSGRIEAQGTVANTAADAAGPINWQGTATVPRRRILCTKAFPPLHNWRRGRSGSAAGSCQRPAGLRRC